MTPQYTAEHREVAVASPLGDDALLLETMVATERLGRLFQFDLTLRSEDREIDFNKIVGQNMTVKVDLPSGDKRLFNGFVSRFVLIPSELRLARYQATLVPWLWFLTRTADCRIFQGKTVPEIIKQIFQDAGFTDFEDTLTRSYRQLDYCVQYRETTFNFVSRLMEQEGIYYFFEHQEGKHVLVLADSINAHQAFPGYKQISYRPDAPSVDLEYISDWVLQQTVQPGTYVHKDFDFASPKKDLLSQADIKSKHAHSSFEVFDYPGDYKESQEEGKGYATIRIEELHASQETVSGTSNARGLRPGYTFELTDHPRGDQAREYLVTETSMDVTSESLYAGSASGRSTYACRFTGIDSSRQFRPQRMTPKPLIQGPQTAIVVGKSGEEIWTDKHGRVKVHFHWDRHGNPDENSSCWVRVSHGWGGKKWGAFCLPRIGQEVIVEFLEGDPDQPIITGRVYNGECTPPYKLPDHATRSTLKSLSSKGGGGFNEIRFEDKKGQEQVFVHAERNQDTRVKNDSLEWVGNDRHLVVKKDQLEQVEGDKHVSVKGNQSEKIGGTVSVQAGGDLQEKVGANAALEAGQEIHLKGGMKVIIEAGMQLTIKAAGGFVDIGPAGVTIQGLMVKINSGGAAGSGSGSSPKSPTLPKEADNDQPGQVTS